MTIVEQTIPQGLLSVLRLAPQELARELLLAACIQWYRQGLLSQSKASEVTGLSRQEFLYELSRRNISVVDLTADELSSEVALLREARRQ
jgi:predicted HTH domain antitoxin